MIKKILTFVCVGLLSLFFYEIATYANTPIPLDISENFHTWELKQNGSIYYVQSNRIRNGATQLEMTLHTTMLMSYWWPEQYPELENFVIDSNGLVESRLEVYTSDETIHLKSTYPIVYEAPGVTDLLFLDSGLSDWRVELEPNDYYQIVLVLNPSLTSSERNSVLTTLNNGYIRAGVKAIDIVITAWLVPNVIDPTLPEQLALLPETGGSIFDDVSDMGNVNIVPLGQNKYLFEILYEGIWEVRYTFDSNTDLTIFDQSIETFYYTHEDEKFLVFNRGNESIFKTNDVTNQTFVPYTIWNLSTNELATINKTSVYLYTQMTSNNHVYGYFYVDDFVIDHLLSVSLAMRYQYTFLIGSNGPWRLYQKVLEADTAVVETKPWQYDFLVNTGVATGVAQVLSGGLSFPTLLIGGGLMLWVGASIHRDPFETGNVTEIEAFNPSPSFKEIIETAYREKDESFDGIKDYLTLYRLDLGEFNIFGSTGIKIDETYSMVEGQQGLNVIEFVYMTNGQVYTIKGIDIDVIFNPGPGTDGNNPDNPGDDEPSNDPNPVWYVLGAIGVLGVSIIAFAVSETKKKGYNSDV